MEVVRSRSQEGVGWGWGDSGAGEGEGLEEAVALAKSHQVREQCLSQQRRGQWEAVWDSSLFPQSSAGDLQLRRHLADHLETVGK